LALPNASFIGFTGALIEQTVANTRAVFGDYISISDIRRAVAEKPTAPIYYESRISKLSLNAAALPKPGEAFEEIIEGEELTKKEKLKRGAAGAGGRGGVLPGIVKADSGEFVDFEERWTSAYIFEIEWQSFRTRQSRDLELTTVSHRCTKLGRYTIAAKVIDIFGNDAMTLMPTFVG
jgi:hypothetical protein